MWCIHTYTDNPYFIYSYVINLSLNMLRMCMCNTFIQDKLSEEKNDFIIKYYKKTQNEN